MRRMTVILLLLCLLLSGCGGGKAAEQGEETPLTPSPDTEEGPAASSAQTGAAAEKEAEAVAPPVDVSRLQEQLNETVLSAVDQTPAGLYEATGLRLLSCTVAGVPEGFQAIPAPDSSVWTYLAGPAGCTRIETGYGQAPLDLLWADADGDGEQELIYWTFGPTSGVFTVALLAYGLEQGIPVCKGHTIWNLSHGTVELLLEGDVPVLCAVPNVWDSAKHESVPGEELRIPLRLDSGSFAPVSGALPEDVRPWGGGPVLGTSFCVLDERWAETLVYRSGHCLISRAEAEDGNDVFWYAVSNDGIRVTGYAYREFPSDGYRYAVGLTPIPAPADLSVLENLSVDALIDRLGPPHFDDGSGIYLLGWLTEDGRLLRASGADKLLGISLYDPVSGESIQQIRQLQDTAAAPDEILVDMTGPGSVTGLDRWTAFQQASAAGRTDRVTLYLLYPEAAFALVLRFDGSRYLLEDEGRETAYSYLLVCEETDPPAAANYLSATHFLLSDDPEMTWERYFAHMVSSAQDPNFPKTRTLFSVYRSE